VTTAPSTGAETSTETPTTTAPARITLAFGGDVHFAENLTALLRTGNPDLAGLRRHLGAADLAVVNLETAITTRGTPAPKRFHFRAPPSALDALASVGVDAVSLANNHAVDYGRVGLTDTLAAREDAPVPVVGIGRNATDAYAPAYLDARGVTVAVIAATQVPDWTLATWPASSSRPGIASASATARLVAAVRAARRRAGVVVVYLHWGTDYTTCPDAAQQATAKALARAGADVIVGAHAHRVQGAGWLGRSYVAYGLGNFVWWRSAEPDSRTGVLTLTLEGRRVVRARWTPMLVGDDGVPRAPARADKVRLWRVWNQARGCTGLRATPPTG